MSAVVALLCFSCSALVVNFHPNNIAGGASQLTPLVVITLDDGRMTDYTNAFRIAQKYNIPLTHYIYIKALGCPTYMTWDEVETLYRAGNDIECHSYNHHDLTTLPDDIIRAEYEAVNLAFVSHGLPEPRHTAYPYEWHDTRVRSITSDFRDTGRSATYLGNEILTPNSCDTRWFELQAFGLHNLSVANVKRLIDNAISEDKVVIFFSHIISDSPTPEGLSCIDFEEICQYIESVNIEAVTISELYSRWYSTKVK